MQKLNKLRDELRNASYADEEQCIANLLAETSQEVHLASQIYQCAADLVERSRHQRDKRGTLDAFLDEFGLANHEGVALMCLAEALLRIPDPDTADALIAEKVHSGDWGAHQGHSDSLFVNASTWGMMLTGKIVVLDGDITRATSGWFRGLVSRLGEPVVRQAMLQAMRIMGGQYILGRSIKEAMKRGPAENPEGTCFSFDMLGEGARTDSDAQRYFQSYLTAIESIAKARQNDRSVLVADGISVKLSALHSHYHQSKKVQVQAELLPRLKHLALAAKAGNIGFNIDAEESERLDISLDLLEQLARDPELASWNGLGFVLQAYQKRAPLVAEWLIQLARDTGRRLMLRLVKGAYWDTEIKRAQALGLADYPVYTRKQNTDLSYQLCAKKLLEASDAVFPQFATHNAHTVATIMAFASDSDTSTENFEFQRLHGMGQLLYEQVRNYCKDYGLPTPRLRVYAPVGAHRDLLPYLVRRLLENGANSSFVNRFLSENIPIDVLVQDVRSQVASAAIKRHPSICLPKNLYCQARVPRANAAGINLEDQAQGSHFIQQVSEFTNSTYTVGPIINGEHLTDGAEPHYSPVNKDLLLGKVRNATSSEIDHSIAAAAEAQPAWDAISANDRAEIIERVGEQLQLKGPELIALISREAGRTLPDALAELREAIDFCYYYAASAKQQFGEAERLAGPTGEQNQLSLHGRGVFLCISPWNFPLAIFIGQVVAALVAGNSVIAKPAEQTPMVAFLAIKLMHQAGVPKHVLQLLTGVGKDIGEQLVSNPSIKGIAFTGSTDTAKLIYRQLSEREGEIIPLIAETGGLNAMIADSSTLPEQLVDDIIRSAFLSAGQRCSALRVLFLQEDIADKVLSLLFGACDALTLSEPWQLDSDIGPVIDKRAKLSLDAHIEKLAASQLYAYPSDKLPQEGYFVGPHIFKIENMQVLEREVFGPILHVITFKSSELQSVLQQINDCGYGLTLGVHSRIEARAREIFRQTRVGNTYVNRDMVGAVVGVNPFGGQGLSGTGPKAGGPHYLLRFATEKTLTINTAATGGNIDLFRSMSEDSE